MTLIAAVGLGHAVDGREAGLQAAHHALNGLGVASPALGFLFASTHYAPRDVLNGAVSLLGDTPIIGLSSPAGLTQGGQHPNAVTIALLGGDIEADAHWFSGYAQSSRDTAQKLSQMSAAADNKAVLFFADGFNGDAEQFCAAMPETTFPIVGALSSGDLHTGSTFQMAGNQSGTGSLAAAILRGDVRVGVGYTHGWDPVGSQFRLSHAHGVSG